MDMPLSINNADNNSELEVSISSNEDSQLINIENIVPDQEVSVTPDALNAVIKYHLDGEGHCGLRQEILKWLGLSAVAAFGVIFYYVPAKAYAETICGDPSYKDVPCGFFVINHLGGTLVVAGTILINATNAYLEQLKAGSIPLKLVNYLEYPFSAKQKTAQEVMTFVCSLIASMPFPILSLVNPLPGLPIALNLSEAFLIWVTNTFLHLFSVDLAFRNRLFRLPLLSFEVAIQEIINAFLNAEEKQEKEMQAQINQHYQTVKQRLINHLDQAQRLLSIYGFRFTGYDYTNEVKNDISDVKEQTHAPLQLLTQLFDRLHEMSPNRTIAPSGRINRFFRQAVYLPGAFWVILSCAGFPMGSYKGMAEYTGDSVSAAVISAPSIYCFGVLLAFFGGNALQNSYDYLTAWKDDTVKIPMAFKLYPKTAVLLIMISMYLSVFSYAAGAQLINDNFNGKLEFLRPYLLDLAKTGLTFLGFTAMIDFFNNVLSKFAQYGGAEDTQTVASLFEALSQMKASLQLMKPNLLLDSLAQANASQLKSILNIKDKNDLQNFSATLIQLAEELKIKIFRKIKSINTENIDEAWLDKLLYQLEKDEDFTVEKIAALISYFDTEPELILSFSLKEVCQEYKALCELMQKLGSVNLVRELDAFPYGSINNDDSLAGPSSEITPLLPRATGSIQSNFFHPPVPGRYHGDRAASLSPAPVFSASNHMGV
jgi:hypothetical protein